MIATVAGINSSSEIIALAVLTCALLLALYRVLRGPSMPDRVVALELISFVVVNGTLTYAILTDEAAFIDVAIVIALIAFLSTVAFARFLERSIG